MSSWPVTFYPRPLIWTATYLSNYFFFSEITGLFDGLFIRLFRSLDQNVYGKNKICSIKSCSWPWPTLLRRSGERLKTFRSSSYYSVRQHKYHFVKKMAQWNCSHMPIHRPALTKCIACRSLNEYFGLVFFFNFVNNLLFFLDVLPQFKTNRSLIVEIVPFWPMQLQSDLHLWPLWPWLSLSLTLTLQHPGRVSYILKHTCHLEKNVRVKMSCWWAYPICIENNSVLHRLWLLHNVSFCHLDLQKSLHFAQFFLCD